MKIDSHLAQAGATLAMEIQQGKWDHVRDLKTKPIGDCFELVEELRKRCPGYETEQYRRALASGVSNTR